MNKIWSLDFDRFCYLIDCLIEDYRSKVNSYQYRLKKIISVFYLYSYSIWALKELKEYVMQHYCHGTRDIQYYIEEFRDMMDDFACISKTEVTKHMFSLAYDEVTNFLDIWLNREEI